MQEEIKKRARALLIKYGIPAAGIAFLALIVLGMIFGPAIKIGVSAGPGELPVDAEWDRFLRYFYTRYGIIGSTREKTLTEEGESYKINEYKIKKFSSNEDDDDYLDVDGNDEGDRVVGHWLNLDVHDDVDSQLRSDDFYGSNGTKKGKWLSEIDVDFFTESILMDARDYIIETTLAQGIELKPYQVHALLPYFYEYGDERSWFEREFLSGFKTAYGTSSAEEFDSWFNRMAEFQSTHGAYSRHELEEKIEEVFGNIMDLYGDIKLFYFGFYDGIDEYWQP